MENTIENAHNFIEAQSLFESGGIIQVEANELAALFFDYADKITADRDRTIADLKRQLAECKAKGRHGLNQSNKFGL